MVVLVWLPSCVADNFLEKIAEEKAALDAKTTISREDVAEEILRVATLPDEERAGCLVTASISWK